MQWLVLRQNIVRFRCLLTDESDKAGRGTHRSLLYAAQRDLLGWMAPSR